MHDYAISEILSSNFLIRQLASQSMLNVTQTKYPFLRSNADDETNFFFKGFYEGMKDAFAKMKMNKQ